MLTLATAKRESRSLLSAVELYREMTDGVREEVDPTAAADEAADRIIASVEKARNALRKAKRD